LVGKVLVEKFLVRSRENEVFSGVGRSGGLFFGGRGFRLFFLVGSESKPSGVRGVSMRNGGELL